MSPEAKQRRAKKRADHGSLRRYRRLLRIMAVWGCNCFYCGQPFSLKKPATIEHLIPRSLGGSDDIENLVAAHERCNSIRGNASLVKAMRVFHQFKDAMRGKAMAQYKYEVISSSVFMSRIAA